MTVGASGGFPLAFLAAFDPGDRVALASPFYPPYVNILTALGMRPVILEAGPETRFQPSVAMLEQLDPPPDGLIVASPCNPAGTMLHPDELAAIAAWCDAAGVRLISDEIYHGLNYDSPIATAASLSPHAVVVNSFSKYFSMTGWRIGWLVLPEDLVRPVERLAQNLFISAPHISQVAAEAAFDCHDELAANVARYRRSRDHLLRALPEAGFTRLSPAEGAFYLFADITDRSNDSTAFCARMLAEVGIAVTPGVDFDHARGIALSAVFLLRPGGRHARGRGAAEGVAVGRSGTARHRRRRTSFARSQLIGRVDRTCLVAPSMLIRYGATLANAGRKPTWCEAVRLVAPVLRHCRGRGDSRPAY